MAVPVVVRASVVARRANVVVSVYLLARADSRVDAAEAQASAVELARAAIATVRPD